MARNKWYAAGLNFECIQCNSCCAGPNEGYVWLTKHEISLLAEHLGLTVEKTMEKYVRKIGSRYSLIEKKPSKDCIFLADSGCAVYSVRPNQCRTWPFWTMNLADDFEWNSNGTTCPGINRGRRYSFEEIEAQRTSKKWWTDEPSDS